MLKSTLLCCLLGVSQVFGELVGPVTISEYGKDVTRYVVSTNASMATTSGSSISLQHNAQVQISANESDTYSPYMFAKYNLDGATVSFTVDISSIGCSCNMAFYFTTAPAIGSDGNPTGGDSGDYYCDANDVNGEYCWELDTMEANMYVSQSTPHDCSAAPGATDYYCDGGGCATNSYNENGNGMCPDSSCLINTQNTFTYSAYYSASNIHVTMTQDSNTFDFDVCGDSSYMSNMEQAYTYGMVMIMSYWGDSYDTMSWLDSMTGCSGDCDTSGTATFSNIVVENTSEKDIKRIEQWRLQNKQEREFITHIGKYGTKEKLSIPKN